jgi:CDP-diacylglycerol---glycerol-3-phosphate 3-phosphatidyltransferase
MPGAVIVSATMAKILSVEARVGVARVMDPIARVLLRAHISPDAVTLAGTVGILVGAIVFGARGHLVAATVIITLCAFTDLLDGSMARQSGRTGKFGALLDSTMDRVADGAIFGAVVYYLAGQHRYAAMTAALICLVAGQVVSCVKARAEGLGMTANVGIAERAERLIIIGLGGLAAAFFWKYALDVALWVLAVLSVITVVQRLLHARHQDRLAHPESR